MIAIAALSGPLPKAGVVGLAALAAVTVVAPHARARALAMLGALVLAPVLLLAAIWHSPQLNVIHRHPLEVAVAAVVALGLISALAVVIARRPSLLALLVALAFPFRIPISVSGTTTNLLVPLYLVVGAGALSYIGPVLRRRARAGSGPDDGLARPEPAPGWIDRLLAVCVLLYAIQAMYSPGFDKALRTVVFFYVPFALMFCLLRRLRWSRQLLLRCLGVLAILAVVFAVIGFVEYATKTLLLNPKLIAQNNLHTYFVINSVFLDPDIFGRFLALVMITLVGVLLYAPRQRDQFASAGILTVTWAGLLLTLSRSSLMTLLVGMGILGALRWKAKPILLSAAAVFVIGAIAVAVSPTTFGVEQGVNGVSSGRGSLIGGGFHLFRERPLWGYGSGSFETEYLCRIKHLCGQQPGASQVLSASHTIPITIGAEQGLIGEIPYLALVVVAGFVLLTGARRSPARAAVAAAFLALVFDTLLYADFLEDPATWILLGIGVGLASAGMPSRIGTRAPPEEVALAA